MLKFRIGVGIYSVPGAQIEQMLLQHDYDPGSFEVLPIVELEYKPTKPIKLYERGSHFAERMRHQGGAEYYIGVASGILKPIGIVNTELRGTARSDIMNVFDNESSKPINTVCLNLQDMRWQLTKRLIGLRSAPESIARLLFSINELCKKEQPST